VRAFRNASYAGNRGYGSSENAIIMIPDPELPKVRSAAARRIDV